MWNAMWRGLAKLGGTLVRVATSLGERLLARLKRLWRGHSTRVATDAAYAAAAALVIGSLVGLVPVKDALGAVLAALLGVHMTNRSQPRSYDSGVSRWDDDWDRDERLA
ncbi:MAG TPA: hypothetical protein VGN18_13735 [Jatrophihabitans sp.]|jgi:uncharacterized membrane protein|uniref:hypothetical protein n=1 Tax=Jatrophihabitans sp. TaxID=1932789 RepID=UPI002DFFA90C|nr:hypothetical protein [Jatrophihabitans sp.]